MKGNIKYLVEIKYHFPGVAVQHIRTEEFTDLNIAKIYAEEVPKLFLKARRVIEEINIYKLKHIETIK